MSKTTTAAESRNQGGFDWIWMSIPHELSPASSSHKDSFMIDDSSLDISNYSRNTFLHFENNSPLSKISVPGLLESFKKFSNEWDNEENHVQQNELYDIYNGMTLTPRNKATDTRFGDQPSLGPLSGYSTTETDSRYIDLHDYLVEKGSASKLIEKEKNNFCMEATEPSDLKLLQFSLVAQALIVEKDVSEEEQEESHVKHHMTDASQSGTSFKEGHPHNCKPCAFYWSKGCNNGDACPFCHYWHVPKRKKPMREQRNLMIIAKDDGKITFLRCSIKDVEPGQ